MEAIERVERNDRSPARFQLEFLMGCSLLKFLHGSFWKVLLKTSYNCFKYLCFIVYSWALWANRTRIIINNSNVKLKKCIYLKLTINCQNTIRNSNETYSKKQSLCAKEILISYQRYKLHILQINQKW